SSRHGSSGISWLNSCQSSRTSCRSSAVAERITGSRSGSQELCEQVVRGQVLEGLEARAGGADVDVTIERAHGLAQGEVARRPGVGTAEIAGEEPVRGPLAEPAQRGQPGLDLVFGQERQAFETEVGASEPDHVLRLAPR